MAEITVRALDSALAMEEIQKRLGDEALIISTKRVDGKIEITASDNEVEAVAKSAGPLILGEAYRKDKFSAVLDQKVNESQIGSDPVSFEEFYSSINSTISEVSNNFNRLRDLVGNFDYTEKDIIGTLDKLQMLGFQKSTLKKFTDIDNKIDINIAIRKLAKSFINGKCTHFDTTNVYVISGQPNSGKTTFADKFIALQKSVDNTRDYVKLTDNNKRKLFSEIKNVNFEHSVEKGASQKAIIIDTGLMENELDWFLLEFKSKRPEVKISVITTLQVGSSYEMVMKSRGVNLSERQYIAVTKLDVCDFSVPEISAMIESTDKCMFFSGIDKVTDGAYFAKLDQVESYLLKKLKEEIE